jgi:uncharacterized repeat protein (TIGR04076 family)
MKNSSSKQNPQKEHSKNICSPFDLRYTVIKTDGDSCPAGFLQGDFIEYTHKDMRLGGSRGACLICLPRLIDNMWRIMGPEPYSKGFYVTPQGERYGRVMCECGGDGGPKLWWEGRKIPRENMDGFYMDREQLEGLNDPMAYDIRAEIVKMKGVDDRDLEMCEMGFRLGDWIHYDPLTRVLSTSREGGEMCLRMLNNMLPYIMAMTWVPQWAERDENGEPYLVYRCNSWADVVWEIRRKGDLKRVARGERPFMTEETNEIWEKGRAAHIKKLGMIDYRYNK